MEHKFWHERWQNNQIGFHEAEHHPLLASHWPVVAADSHDDVFVPLCGKSLDMCWLANHGHGVVGSELSEIAVQDFFTSICTEPETVEHGEQKLYAHGNYKLWCGDFFALSENEVAPITLFYDRAALIALPEAMRQRYAQHLISLMAPGAHGLLITIQYTNEEHKGPPFSVPLVEIDALFSEHCSVEHLEHAESNIKGRFIAQETATLIIKNA
ncbi:MAG: thiopurine S-methyltransferase [Gammaproteobacteria bacterium]